MNHEIKNTDTECCVLRSPLSSSTAISKQVVIVKTINITKLHSLLFY